MGLTNFPNGIGATGSFIILKKTLTSSDITTGGIDVTNASTNGELAIVDVILKTDSTGLAGGTNVEIKTDNDNGAATFYSETVANLGANATVELADASVSNSRTVLETGKKVTINMTVGNGTGAGTVDVYLFMMRKEFNADITAA